MSTVYTLRPIKHISPSSLKMWETQPHRFFMERILVPGWKREPSGPAAIRGTIFDVYAKSNLAETLGTFPALLEKIGLDPTFPKHKAVEQMIIGSCGDALIMDKDLEIGRAIYEYYRKILMNSTILFDLSWHDIELRKQINIVTDEYTISTYCKGDFSLSKQDILFPGDWKVIGSNSSASPKKFYQLIFDENLLNRGSHKGWYPQIHMEDIDSDWATQLVFTGWQLGYSYESSKMVDYDGIIHCLVCDTTKEPLKIRLAIYRACISVTWQRKVLERVINMWRSIADGSYYNLMKSIDLTSMIAKDENWF